MSPSIAVPAVDTFEQVGVLYEQCGAGRIQHEVHVAAVLDEDVELPVRREHEQRIQPHGDITPGSLLVAERDDAVGHRNVVAQQIEHAKGCGSRPHEGHRPVEHAHKLDRIVAGWAEREDDGR
jgi:hypothetical protein